MNGRVRVEMRCPGFSANRKSALSSMTLPRLVRIYVTGTRIFLGLTFFTAGMGKLIRGFPGFIGPIWLEEKLVPYSLGLFARFIAISQVMTGLLLLTGRFATLGAIVLVPLLSCILVVTISLQWRGTPYINAFLLLLNLSLLVYDWPKLKFIFAERREEVQAIPLQRSQPRHDALWLLAAALFLCGLLTLRVMRIAPFMLIAGGAIFLALSLLARFWQSHGLKV